MAELALLSERMSARHPVTVSDDSSALLERANEISERNRPDIERIVATLSAGAERGALLQSRQLGQAIHDADTTMLEITEMLHTHATASSDADERVRALKTRLKSLKREIVAASVERDRLEQQLAEREHRYKTLQLALLEFIGADPDASPDLDHALSHEIREIWRAIRSLERQSSPDKEAFLEQIERLRLANTANFANGSKNLTGRIDALQAAIDSVPVTETGEP
jgi:chromosome segregation ATPase